MIRPILVWGTKGTCCSMLIWIIKKLSDPEYFVENPINASGAAHNQPMPEHWYGNTLLEDVINGSDIPLFERVYHCEPTSVTWTQGLEYKSIAVHASTRKELQQIAVFQKYKNYDHLTTTLDISIRDLYRVVESNSYVRQPKPGALNFTVGDINNKDIHPVLEQICKYLEIPVNTKSIDIITKVHSLWVDGNNNLLNKHLHKLL